MVTKRLFDLSLKIFGGDPNNMYGADCIIENKSENALFFVADHRRFIKPENSELLSVSSIWEMVKHDSSGIFCYSAAETGGPAGYLVCATCLGHDARGEEIAAGFIESADKSKTGRVDEKYYESLATIKRFYGAFAESGAIAKLIHEKARIHYLIDANSKSIIHRHIPVGEDSREIGELCRHIISENFLRQILDGRIEDDNQRILDSQIKEFSISKFKLVDHEFALISFELTGAGRAGQSEYDMIVRNFSHKIRNNLTALQSAADQLSLQKGKELNDDDISLTKVIYNVSENMNHIVGRLHQFSVSADLNISNIDLGEVIEDAINKETLDSGSTHRIFYSPSESPRSIEADSVGIEIAVRELLRNALEASCGEDKIQISIQDLGGHILIMISDYNMQADISHDNYEEIDRLDPFHSTKPDGTGMGIRIARRIIVGHGGTLTLERNQRNQHRAIIKLPKIQTREIVH